MEPQPETLDFVKAMSDSDRLRVIGVLSRRASSLAQIAESLHMPASDAFNHVSYLVHVGVVREADGEYQLVGDAVDAMARKQFGGRKEAYVPAPDLDEKSRKVLVAYLNPDGTIRQIPTQPEKLKIVLRYLVASFTPGVDYTEKEVNTVIRRFNVDVSGLRRDLIDQGLMARERDGSRYWRVA
ncbi:MAG: DUF2087 domain-containing protein [Chloroflexota bacterium]